GGPVGRRVAGRRGHRLGIVRPGAAGRGLLRLGPARRPRARPAVPAPADLQGLLPRGEHEGRGVPARRRRRRGHDPDVGDEARPGGARRDAVVEGGGLVRQGAARHGGERAAAADRRHRPRGRPLPAGAAQRDVPARGRRRGRPRLPRRRVVHRLRGRRVAGDARHRLDARVPRGAPAVDPVRRAGRRVGPVAARVEGRRDPVRRAGRAARGRRRGRPAPRLRLPAHGRVPGRRDRRRLRARRDARALLGLRARGHRWGAVLGHAADGRLARRLRRRRHVRVRVAAARPCGPDRAPRGRRRPGPLRCAEHPRRRRAVHRGAVLLVGPGGLGDARVRRARRRRLGQRGGARLVRVRSLHRSLPARGAPGGVHDVRSGGRPRSGPSRARRTSV
ncbi:MAG: Ferredoxin reductase, partial [uncultured Solirubrobacteraceae bacterium]